MNKTTVAVVGGGIIGLGIAWQLAKRGYGVTVLERRTPGREASWAAAGMLAPMAETVESGPAQDLGVVSLRMFPQYLADIAADAGGGPGLVGPGILRLAFDRAQLRRLEAMLASFERMSLPARLLGQADLRALEPDVAPEAIGALHSPQEQHVDPRALCAALERAATAVGVVFVNGAQVMSIEPGEQMTVRHASGSMAFDRVVIAAGAWSGPLAEQFGIHLPIFPRKGQVIAVRPPSQMGLSHTIYAHHTYLVPRDGRILVGATEEDKGFDPSIDASTTAHLLAGAQRLSPALAGADVLEEWMGYRPASADGLSILGPLPTEPRVYVASGHRRNGILLAPITAIKAAAEIDGVEEPSLNAFRPDRFSVRAQTTRRTHRVVLSIAGSDPSGGAGIQTDQRVIESLGCAAMTIPTALTSQNSHEESRP